MLFSRAPLSSFWQLPFRQNRYAPTLLKQAAVKWVSFGGVLALLAFLATPSTALAVKPDTFSVVIQVIEASNVGNRIDPRLKALKKDLQTLPFKSFTLTDRHKKKVKKGDRISFEFPSHKGKRFLKLTAHGQQRSGKLRFQLTIDKLKFDTLVAVPNRGTILIAGPRNGKNVMLFAVTATKR
ncbi:MAG: hypothetical protein GY822_15370 [Deltaproteobacteria bacterium]|nr:hypothetical protein [Deltaproteobacteria bacterium]